MTTIHRVGRLRIRPGPGADAAARAQRLRDVAHRLLGAELDHALADLPDVRVDVGRLTVRLELDPTTTDEHALAVLWADLIRRELLRRIGTPEPRGIASALDIAEPSPDVAGTVPDARTADPAVTALAGLLRRMLASPLPLAPADLRGLAAHADEPHRTAAALALLRPPDRTGAQRLLGRAGVPVPPETSSPDPAPEPDPVEESPAADWFRHPGEVSARTHDPASPAQGLTAAVTAAEPDPAPAERPESRVAVSSYGGLVLLHHRLQPLLATAAARRPDDDPIAARTDALAVLCRGAGRPDDPRPVRADPLVLLLAGDPDWAGGAARPPALVPPDVAAAEAVLGAFAADLPGFDGSSPDFVRDQWLDRRALLVEEPDAVLLRLGRRPLDLVLDRLPYPIGALALAWTPAILVGWEGSA